MREARARPSLAGWTSAGWCASLKQGVLLLATELAVQPLAVPEAAQRSHALQDVGVQFSVRWQAPHGHPAAWGWLQARVRLVFPTPGEGKKRYRVPGVRAPTCSSLGNPGVPALSPCCACVLPWDPEIRVSSSSSLSNLGIPPSSCFSRWGPLIFWPPPFLPQGARCSVVPYSQVPGVFLNLLQLCGGREAEMRSCEHSGPQGKLMGWLWGSVKVPLLSTRGRMTA